MEGERRGRVRKETEKRGRDSGRREGGTEWEERERQ